MGGISFFLGGGGGDTMNFPLEFGTYFSCNGNFGVYM